VEAVDVVAEVVVEAVAAEAAGVVDIRP